MITRRKTYKDMKKYLIFLAVGMMLSACSNDEPEVAPPVNPDEYIMFGLPSVPDATRAPLTAFPDGGQFQVLGYLKSYLFTSSGINGNLDDSSVATGWDTKEDVTPPSVFGGDVVNTDGVTVTYSGGYCSYDNLERWHSNANARYSFYYYYPASGYFTTTFGTVQGTSYVKGFPDLTFTMPFNGGDGSTARDMEAVPDAMYGYSEDVVHGTGTVVPQFRHLLAGLNIQVNNYNTNNDVVVTSVRVYSSNFRRDCTLRSDFTTVHGSETFGGSFEFAGGGAVTVPKVEQETEEAGMQGNSEKVGGTLLLVPYTSAGGVYFGDDTQVEVTYTFGGGTKTERNPLSFGLTINPGTIYTLQLNFVGSDLVLDFIVDNNNQWQDGNEGDSNGNITFE